MSAEASAGPTDNPGEFANVLELRMPGDPTAIAAVTDTISDQLTQLNVSEDKRLEIVLAVQEALANAVVHGCKNDSSKEVRCRLECYSSGRILITVTDPGPGFQPGRLSDPKHAENLYSGHGRGVYLIRQLMDEVSFESNGSEIRMWKY
jgi:serine/threonine-protein kinase RsbW